MPQSEDTSGRLPFSRAVARYSAGASDAATKLRQTLRYNPRVQLAWESVLSIIGSVGGVCGFWSLWYTRRQTLLMEKQVRREEKQDVQDNDDLQWAERFDRLARQLTRISPALTVRDIMLYPSIFPDIKLQQSLETYIVEVNSSKTCFLARNPRPDELRRAALREAVQKAEECIARFQKQWPAIDLKY